MSPPPVEDVIPSFPFDLFLATFIALIVSFVLIHEEEEAKQEEIDRELQRFAALLASTAQATFGGGTRSSTTTRDNDKPSSRRTYNNNNNEGEEEEQQTKKRRYIAYDRERTRNLILQDYLGEDPIFDGMEFQRMFRISRQVYNRLKEEVREHPFYNVPEFDIVGRMNICQDAKLMIALKHLAYGVATNSWRDYFQMGESTGRQCVEVLCHCVCNSKSLRQEFLRRYTLDDAKRVSAMHHRHHGVTGMLGSLDCMHVRWKNCPVALQGVYMGKEKFPTIVLEAVADANLWFWHAAFGFPGSCNNINILDVSPFHKCFVDGSHSEYDFEFQIDDRVFSKPYYLVDGIYPKLSRFVKTISVPVNQMESRFAGWQEAARKDVERAFGVLQSKWRLLSHPIEKWDEIRIQEMVVACIIMHNMMVQQRLDGGDDAAIAENYFATSNEDDEEHSVPRLYHDEAEERVGAIEAEMARFSGDPRLQFHEDRIRLFSYTQRVVQERWTMLYDKKEHYRLQNALISEVNKKY